MGGWIGMGSGREDDSFIHSFVRSFIHWNGQDCMDRSPCADDDCPCKQTHARK